MSEKKDSTFVVHVMGNENGSWQGQLTWADKNETVGFRSALELIKLMDEAIKTED